MAFLRFLTFIGLLKTVTWGMHGVTLRYGFDLLADNGAGLLTAMVNSVGASESNKKTPAFSQVCFCSAKFVFDGLMLRFVGSLMT